MRSEARVLALAITALATQPAVGDSIVVCKSQDKGDIVLAFDAVEFDGEMLSCVTQSDFVYDMTPCAPAGGYGLSAPMGSADLVRVVPGSQEFSAHNGGVVGFHSAPTWYQFDGGFNYSGEYEEAWSLVIDRLTGDALLSVTQEVEEGGEAGVSEDIYACAQVERKF